MKWVQEPPAPEYRGQQPFPAWLLELRERPGAWALVESRVSGSAATARSNALRKRFARELETTVRGCDIYARVRTAEVERPRPPDLAAPGPRSTLRKLAGRS